jgi:VanZ family protein
MGIIKNRKYLAINLILFAILYFSVSFNKEYIRPVYGHSPVIGIITGSFSNFMAAYIVSLFSVAAILAKKIEIKKAKLIFYVISILVFIILTIEELKPFVSASKTYDIYDILASGLGSFLAILTFEVFIKKIIKKRNKRSERNI